MELCSWFLDGLHRLLAETSKKPATGYLHGLASGPRALFDFKMNANVKNCM